MFLFGEYSRPYAEFSHELYHHRWNHKDVFQRDSWKGRGESYTGGIGINLPPPEKHLTPFLAYTEESYNPEINGTKNQVNEKAIRIGLKGDF